MSHSWVLYGAGDVGRRAGEALIAAGDRVEGYLDRTATPGRTLNGIPVLTPATAPRSWRGLRCAVTIFNRAVHAPTIVAELRAAGWQKVITYLDFFHALEGRLEDRFWLTARQKVTDAQPRWQPLDARWADPASQDLFQRLMRMRNTGVESEAPLPGHGQVQYLPDDIPGWRSSEPLSYVDGGAYDGSSLLAILDAGQPLMDVHAFEPEIANHRKLLEQGEALARQIQGRASLWPCGLAERSGTVSFRAGAGESSSIDPEGSSSITVVALDEVLPQQRLDVVKLDVEGAEAAALQGMATLIRRHLPRLAISVYHRWNDLWELPFLIDHLSEGRYRLYLRSHGLAGFDTVLYAVPSHGASR